MFTRLRSTSLAVLIETYWNVNPDPPPPETSMLLVLIETYWNVNARTQSRSDKGGTCLNRNILECKCRIYQSDKKSIKVLIETYWNVNGLFMTDKAKQEYSLNRNILECKC